MAKLYLNKIIDGEINPATEEAWILADVPALWRAEVQELLNDQTHDST